MGIFRTRIAIFGAACSLMSRFGSAMGTGNVDGLTREERNAKIAARLPEPNGLDGLLCTFPFLPEFMLAGCKMLDRRPGWLFRPDDRYELYRVTMAPR